MQLSWNKEVTYQKISEVIEKIGHSPISQHYTKISFPHDNVSLVASLFHAMK